MGLEGVHKNTISTKSPTKPQQYKSIPANNQRETSSQKANVLTEDKSYKDFTDKIINNKTVQPHTTNNRQKFDKPLVSNKSGQHTANDTGNHKLLTSSEHISNNRKIQGKPGIQLVVNNEYYIVTILDDDLEYNYINSNTLNNIVNVGTYIKEDNRSNENAIIKCTGQIEFGFSINGINFRDVFNVCDIKETILGRRFLRSNQIQMENSDSGYKMMLQNRGNQMTIYPKMYRATDWNGLGSKKIYQDGR